MHRAIYSFCVLFNCNKELSQDIDHVSLGLMQTSKTQISLQTSFKAQDVALFFQPKTTDIFFLISPWKIYWGYLLEVHLQGDSRVILEGDLGEKVSLSWLTSSYLELREKWKCIDCIGKSKIWTKTSPWNPDIVAKLLPLWKLQDDLWGDVLLLRTHNIWFPGQIRKISIPFGKNIHYLWLCGLSLMCIMYICYKYPNIHKINRWNMVGAYLKRTLSIATRLSCNFFCS